VKRLRIGVACMLKFGIHKSSWWYIQRQQANLMFLF